MQQEVDELKTINEATSFRRQKRLFRSFSFVENARHDILNTNISILTKKSMKHFDFESFINRRKDFK